MGKWIERFKHSVTLAPSGAGSKGTEVNERLSNHQKNREGGDSEESKKDQNVSPHEGPKGAKGGLGPFGPSSNRPSASNGGQTVSPAHPRASIVENRPVASPAEWMVLESWVQTLSSSDLPPQPFTLDHAIVVVDKEKYLKALKREAELGPNGPRARSGAFQAECSKLRALLDATPESASFFSRESTPVSTREGGGLYKGPKHRALVVDGSYLKPMS